MAKSVDIFNPAATSAAPAPVSAPAAPAATDDRPELRRRPESRSVRQQYLLPPSLLEKLEAAAKEYGASKNSIVVAALEKYLG